LLLLDEPYSGLDTASVSSLDEILYEAISEGSAVLMTTHDFEHGLHLADRLDVLLGGHIAASLSHEEMQNITPADWYLRKLDEFISQTAGAQPVC
jgi:vitamin B12 transport system ATP-binding protein